MSGTWSLQPPPVPGVLSILVGVWLSWGSPPSPVPWECGILLGQDPFGQSLSAFSIAHLQGITSRAS